MPILNLPCAHGGPVLTGTLRARPSDFRVEEQLGFSATGDGEHVFLQIEKCQMTTAEVVAILAGFAGLPRRRISFSGVKDKQAVTRQWFSVHLPGKQAPDWTLLQRENLQILHVVRHQRKLRRGSHRRNGFALWLRDCRGDWSRLEQRVEAIRQHGVPNYFTEQRFGLGQGNLDQARRWFAGGPKPERLQRGFYLSAARAWLFNRVLASRVEQGSWDRLQRGEVVVLDGSQSHFVADEPGALQARLASGDLHPSGPLPGLLTATAVSAPRWQQERVWLQGDEDLLQGAGNPAGAGAPPGTAGAAGGFADCAGRRGFAVTIHPAARQLRHGGGAGAG